MTLRHYNEFLAIESPLSGSEIDLLRAQSPSSLVRSTGFILDTAPLTLPASSLMRRFFDARIWLSSSRQAAFQLRVPKNALDDEAVLVFEAEPALEVGASPTHWLFSWILEASDHADRFHPIDGSGWMSRLVPLREEVLRGDLRSLYIGWLAAVTRGDIAENSMEPMPWHGTLSSAQRSLAEFLDVDDGLLGAACHAPCAVMPFEHSTDIEAWLGRLEIEEMRAALRELMHGRTVQARRLLTRSYQAWHADMHISQPNLRTVRELWELTLCREQAQNAEASSARRI